MSKWNRIFCRQTNDETEGAVECVHGMLGSTGYEIEK
jgi:hypothetical protein